MKQELPSYLKSDPLNPEALHQLSFSQRFIHGLVKYSTTANVETINFFQQEFDRTRMYYYTGMPFSIDRDKYVEMGIDEKTVYTAQPNEVLPYLALLSSNNAVEATSKMATIRGVNHAVYKMLFDQLYE
jgi:hypothetical protein